MGWLGVLLFLVCIQIAAIVILEFRRPSNAIAWIVIVYIFPLIGLILYYFIAQRFNHKRVVRDSKHKRFVGDERTSQAQTTDMCMQEKGLFRQVDEEMGYARLVSLLDKLPVSRAFSNNKVAIMADASDVYDAMLEAMERAQDHIHVQFYTIRDDRIGKRFQEVWKRKASEGVKVRVLYDGVGSWRLGRRYIDELQRAQVETACFLPPFIAFLDKRINYRNHRKLVIVDGEIGYVGGLNIGDEYLGENQKLGYWRDTHMQIQGDAVHEMQRIFIADWHLGSGKVIQSPMLFPELTTKKLGDDRVQLVTSGPDTLYEPILEVAFTAINIARERIWLTTPYFIPDSSLFMALKTAAVCGVEVKLMIPATPDSKLVYYASQSYLKELLQAGVQVYRYERGFLHAKTMLIDHVLASVGTANLDMRSLHDNFEMNALLSDAEHIEKLEQQFLMDIKDCSQLSLSRFERRSPVQRGMEAAARLLSPLL